MLGLSNRQLLLLSLAINLVLLTVNLQGLFTFDLGKLPAGAVGDVGTWSGLRSASGFGTGTHAGGSGAPVDGLVGDDEDDEKSAGFVTGTANQAGAGDASGVVTQVIRSPRCTMCEADQALCDEIGKDRMNMALSYAGSNRRLRRVLKKMKSGEPWVLGVIGGSVSKSHGIAHGNVNDKPYINKHRLPNMHRVVFDHLDSLFPSSDPQVAQSIEKAVKDKEKKPAWKSSLTDLAAYEGPLTQDLAEIKRPISRAYGFSARQLGVNSFVNGAQGATGSDYFGYCFAEHIPEDVDLILVELGINDERQLKTFDNYELMLRGLLDLPNQPAIIYVEIFQLMFATMSYGADIHRGINEWYDVPSVSLRNAYLPQALANKDLVPSMFVPDKAYHDRHEGIDLRHLSNEYHNRTGQLVNAYIDAQLCEMEQEGDVDYAVDPLPRQMMSSMYDLEEQMPVMRPSCYSTTSEKHKLVPTKADGWEDWAWKEKKYIVAKKPGSKVSFAVSTAMGTIQIIYLRSFELGLGKARCELEGVPHSQVVLDGYWKSPYNILQTHSMRHIPAGDYTLTCELSHGTNDPDGGTEFRLASITSM